MIARIFTEMSTLHISSCLPPLQYTSSPDPVRGEHSTAEVNIHMVIDNLIKDPAIVYENVHLQRMTNAVRTFEETGRVVFHPKMRVVDVHQLNAYFDAYTQQNQVQNP